MTKKFCIKIFGNGLGYGQREDKIPSSPLSLSPPLEMNNIREWSLFLDTLISSIVIEYLSLTCKCSWKRMGNTCAILTVGGALPLVTL